MSPRIVGGRGHSAVAGWHEIGGRRMYLRSRLELRHAQYLELLRRSGEIVDWEHEPKRFEFPIRGSKSYKPDFRVTFADGRVVWHECKGWLDPASATKVVRMARYYPDEMVVLVGLRIPRDPEAAHKHLRFRLRVDEARALALRERAKEERKTAKRQT